MREILTSSLPKIVEVQKEKTDLSCVCKSLIRGAKWKWVGGWHYYVFTSKCCSIGMCKLSCFKVENNIGKLVFWRDVSYSPKLTSLWNH
jgi:hypothetical protein